MLYSSSIIYNDNYWFLCLFFFLSFINYVLSAHAELDYLRFLQDDIDKMVSKLEERIQNLEEGSCMDALVLPLHGSLPPELQASS